MEKNRTNTSLGFLLVVSIMVLCMAFVAPSAHATDTTRPTILSVSPMNNDEGNTRTEQITVVFSEDMDPLSINAHTFTLMQRTTPKSEEYRSRTIDGMVTYSGRTATFTQDNMFNPSQQYGNVFTGMITTGAMDLAGNSLSRNYVWSFTTGTTPFHTGATTSQKDQSAVPITGLAVATIPAPPVATIPETDVPVTIASTFPWVWIIGGLLLALLIISVFTPVMKSASRKKIQAAHPDPFGDVHPVADIEGIGPEFSKRLRAIGIKNTKQLWEADAVKVARKTGAALGSVKSWQHMAELASVKDIGPQYAELLERSGIHTIEQLKSTDPDRLLRLVRKKQNSLDVNIQGNSPGHATVEHWIGEARDHKFGEAQIA
jgi:predicted flap endonuclease-1-like 5' DNA nuclease